MDKKSLLHWVQAIAWRLVAKAAIFGALLAWGATRGFAFWDLALLVAFFLYLLLRAIAKKRLPGIAFWVFPVLSVFLFRFL